MEEVTGLGTRREATKGREKVREALVVGMIEVYNCCRSLTPEREI